MSAGDILPPHGYIEADPESNHGVAIPVGTVWISAFKLKEAALYGWRWNGVRHEDIIQVERKWADIPR
jgi:hypothetical protein